MPKFHWVSQAFHWLMAALILVLLSLGVVAVDLPNSPLKIQLFFWHKSLGILVLALWVPRLLWRLSHLVPVLPPAMPRWEVLAAKTTHVFLYGLMVFIPLSGWVLNSAANYPFKVFGVLNLPAIVSPSEWLQSIASQVHEAANYLLFALICLHVMAALKHHFVQKDGVLLSMWPARKGRLLLLALLAGLSILIAQSLPEVNIAEGGAPEAGAAPLEAAPEDSAKFSATQWQVLPNSRVAFTGAYDDVPFDGVFERFAADIYFDASNLAISGFDVKIDVTSANTRSSDRDDALAGQEWFDYERFPKAAFKTTVMRAVGEGRYEADARLRIRQQEQSLIFPFEWQPTEDGGATLRAELVLNRLDYNLGTGMWADETIAHDVNVFIQLFLRPL